MAITKLEITGNTTAVGLSQTPLVVSTANESAATTFAQTNTLPRGNVQDAIEYLDTNKLNRNSGSLTDGNLVGDTTAESIQVRTYSASDVPNVTIAGIFSETNTSHAQLDFLYKNNLYAGFGSNDSHGVRFNYNGNNDRLEIKTTTGSGAIRDVIHIATHGFTTFYDLSDNSVGMQFYTQAGGATSEFRVNVPTKITEDITNTGKTITTGTLNLGDQDLSIYKTGTWTPSIQDITFSVHNADYIQIGNMVTLSLSLYDVDTSSVSDTSTLEFFITGLPISPKSGASNAQLCAPCLFDFHDLPNDTVIHTEVVNTPGSDARINFIHGHTKTSVTHTDIPNTVPSGVLNLQVTYFV